MDCGKQIAVVELPFGVFSLVFYEKLEHRAKGRYLESLPTEIGWLVSWSQEAEEPVHLVAVSHTILVYALYSFKN